jgi:hypothetical protein
MEQRQPRSARASGARLPRCGAGPYAASTVRAVRAFNKLARTFAAQLEALKRYRTGGEQKVTVEHVTVNEGGGR